MKKEKFAGKKEANEINIEERKKEKDIDEERVGKNWERKK